MWKIPRIKLDVSVIANRAEKRGMCVIDSDQCGMCYICEGDKMLICTGVNGYLVLSRDKIERIARELLEISSVMRDRPMCWR